MKQPELIIEDMLPQARKINTDKKELRTLADDIHTNGLKHPILVMDGVVVDGLKRVEAFKLLGRARVPALFTSNFGEAADHLAKVRETETLGVRREIELIEQLEPFRARFHKRRFSADAVKEDESKPWFNQASRDMLGSALNRSVSYTEALLYILKVAPKIPEAARRLELIKKGEDTVHGTRMWLYEHRNTRDLPEASAQDILATTDRGFQDIQTILGAIGKHGSMMALSREERVEILGRAEKVRQQLFRVAKAIRGGLQIEAKEGKEG